MKRLLLSVCIPALTFFGFSLKAHAAETHSAPAFMNAEGEGIFPKGKTNDAYAQYFNGTSYLQASTGSAFPVSWGCNWSSCPLLPSQDGACMSLLHLETT